VIDSIVMENVIDSRVMESHTHTHTYTREGKEKR